MVESTSEKNVASNQPRRILSLFDAVCIIVGTIIGSGIFATAPFIAQNANNFALLIVLWIVGGLVALVGALCFAELMTTNQNVVGGDYIYLKKAYGRPIAFMFAWAAFWIIRPGNIGAMAMIFAQYFNQILPGGEFSRVLYGLAAVVLLSVTNLLGLKQGKVLQNLLTTAKVLGILAIVVLAAIRPAEQLNLPAPNSASGSIWLAMILIMFTYGGWNDISFVTGEIRDPKRNLFRSLWMGTLTVTAIYVAVNIAFVVGLGYEAMANSQAVATDLSRQALGADSILGQRSGQLIAALVCISCLGAINGMILTSPRIYYAVGRDLKPLSFLSEWNRNRDVPWQAILLQAIVTIGLISICLLYQDAFEVLVVVTAPYFWGFLALTVFALMVLRIKKSFQPSLDDLDAGIYRVPLYPLPPVFFGAVCIGLLYNAITYLFAQKYEVAFAVVTGVMVVGIVLSLLFSRPKFQTNLDDD